MHSIANRRALLDTYDHSVTKKQCIQIYSYKYRTRFRILFHFVSPAVTLLAEKKILITGRNRWSIRSNMGIELLRFQYSMSGGRGVGVGGLQKFQIFDFTIFHILKFWTLK